LEKKRTTETQWISECQWHTKLPLPPAENAQKCNKQSYQIVQKSDFSLEKVANSIYFVATTTAYQFIF